MKPCEVCGAPLRIVGRHKQARFCSSECTRNQGVLKSKVCARCGWQRPKEMFGVDRHSLDGLNSMCRICRRDGKLAPDDDDDESPMEWDGQTQYSDSPRRPRPYQVVCLQAGHVMKRNVRLTEFQAARIVILGFKTRCDVCNGWLMLESDEDGQIGDGQHVRLRLRRGKFVGNVA